jgi:hypothetical protein
VGVAATKMRQSLAQLERAFVEETEADRQRREELRRRAVQRSRTRHVQRINQRGSMRFGVLALVLVLTAVAVTVAMFETLYYVMG